MSSVHWNPTVLAVAGSPTTHPWLLLHLSGPNSKTVEASHYEALLVVLISLLCFFHSVYASVNSTFAQFSSESCRVCLLFPAGSLTNRSMTWNKKHKVSSDKGRSPNSHSLSPLPIPTTCFWTPGLKMQIWGKVGKPSQIQGDKGGRMTKWNMECPRLNRKRMLV